MALRNLVSQNVNNAFRLIGDLAEPITFTRMQAEFDLNSDENGFDETEQSTININGVISSQTRDVENSSIILTEVVLKSSDVTANNVILDSYDTISFRNKVWNVDNYSDNGFITTVFVRRSTT